MERDPDDDDAVVVGAGEGRGDRGQGERRTLEGPGQVHLAEGVERVGAGAGGNVRRPDLARRRGSWSSLLGAAGVLRPPPRSRPPGSR